MSHRALMVDEILREVTAQVTRTHPPTAVAVACCAKFLEEPTLSVLWRIQDGLPTLIKTLSPDSWELHIGEVEDTITFTRNPSKEEWARLLRYASWMTELDNPDVVAISDDVFRQLTSATSGDLVCPQLRRLAWPSSYGLEPMQQFLSPHLTSVVFYGEPRMEPNPDLALFPAISLLPTIHLEDLNLNIYPPPSPIHSVLSDVVQRLSPCFKSLATWSSLSEVAWGYLGSLPKLEWLRVSDVPRTEILKSIPRRNVFAALQCIEIRVNNPHQPWLYFFSLLESSPLREITVTRSRTIQGVDIPGQVTTAMLEAELQRTVNSLTFSGSDPANFMFLSHIGRFSFLKTLNCATRCRFPRQCVSPLVDSDIEQLASELPQLVTVWLGHECKYTHHNTTIKSLISFSTHCLSLDNLCFPCNLINISEDIKTELGVPDPRLEILSPCKLQFLGLLWVAMPSPYDTKALRIMTSALDHLFPRFHQGTDWGLKVCGM